MGISWRQDRGTRAARRRVDPRAQGRARDRGEGSLSRAVHLCFAYLWRISPFDAALCLPPLGGNPAAAPSRGAEMGTSQGHEGLSHARGRRAAHTHAARPAMKNFTRDTRGATAIEYGMIAALIAMVIITAVTTVGTTLSSTLYGSIATAVTASAP